MTVDTGPTSAELLTAEAERLLLVHGVHVTPTKTCPSGIALYRPGEVILYLGASARPMTAWIIGEPGEESISTEAGFQAEPTSRAFARTRVLGREAAQADLADADQA